jgi:hypothetical protein
MERAHHVFLYFVFQNMNLKPTEINENRPEESVQSKQILYFEAYLYLSEWNI